MGEAEALCRSFVESAGGVTVLFGEVVRSILLLFRKFGIRIHRKISK